MNTKQLLQASIAHEENKKLKREFVLIKALGEKVLRLEAQDQIKKDFISFWLDDFEGAFDNRDITYESAEAYVKQATYMKRECGRDDAGMIVRIQRWLNDFVPEEWQIP